MFAGGGGKNDSYATAHYSPVQSCWTQAVADRELLDTSRGGHRVGTQAVADREGGERGASTTGIEQYFCL